MEPQTPIQPQGQPPQAGSSYQATDGTQLNPTAVALAKSIRQVESQGNYNAVGDSGESHGAYQFNKDNFQNWAKQYNLDPNDFSPVNQDKVAYHRINDMLKQGNAPSEVAARWNGAKYVNGKYEALKQEYVDKVKNAYQGVVGNGQLAPGVPALQLSQNTNQESQLQEQGLGSQLAGRTNDAGQAVQDTLSGKINPLSGLIQVGGAIGGAAGDVVNKALELIPGVKQVENLIGQGVGSLAQTPTGQSVMKSIQQFSSDHPELSKDIGAGFNIVTAIPIFKGLGVLKNVAMDGIAQALKGAAEKGATKSLTEVVSRTVGGRKLLDAVPDSVETMIKERALPEIENGKYITENAVGKLSDSISTIDKNELQPILDNVSKNQNFGTPLGTLKKLAIDEAENDPSLKEAGMVPKALKQIESRFEGWQHSYGDSVDLATENRLKIGTGKFTDWGTPEGSADKAIYHAFQGHIEDVAEKNGLGDVKAINQKMAKLINTRKLFKYIDGKSVKTGIGGDFIKAGATAGGEALGNMTGIPFAGGIGGYRAGSYAAKKLGGGLLTRSILERTGKGAVRTGARQGIKGLLKAGAGAFAQKATGNQ